MMFRADGVVGGWTKRHGESISCESSYPASRALKQSIRVIGSVWSIWFIRLVLCNQIHERDQTDQTNG